MVGAGMEVTSVGVVEGEMGAIKKKPENVGLPSPLQGLCQDSLSFE